MRPDQRRVAPEDDGVVVAVAVGLDDGVVVGDDGELVGEFGEVEAGPMAASSKRVVQGVSLSIVY